MPQRRSSQPQISIIKQLQPTASVVAGVVLVVIWAYTTFAQISYVDRLYKESMQYTDLSNARMSAVLSEISNNIKAVQEKLIRMDERRLDERGLDGRTQTKNNYK